MFRFPSPDRPIFFEKWKKNPDSLVKEASTLLYKQRKNNWYDVIMSLSLINIDTTFLKAV